MRTYVELGFPALLGTDEDGLRALVEPLRAQLPPAGAPTSVPPEDHVPFVLVLALERPGDAVPAMRLGRRGGVSLIDDDELATYRPVVDVPDGPAHLVRDVDTGTRFLGVTPESATETIRAEGRRPLTVAEGLALVVVRPDMLRPGRCFSLAGSRTGTNQRVPAVWISERRPKLGWCWDRNPHTWLGTASAAG
ncbi:hypothetical protein FE251_07520 [Georgenia wutianyii]|uniref:Uncharacterized protein n=1 Tax=Georgenia wutianyii TaxID=2585135 RepID=A0ABX5VTP6_9MICO|nr:hypothetical protein FE251_07520 [Georgenia wutianyii]